MGLSFTTCRYIFYQKRKAKEEKFSFFRSSVFDRSLLSSFQVEVEVEMVGRTDVARTIAD